MWIVFVVLPRNIFKVKNPLVLGLIYGSSLHWGVLTSFQLLLQKGVSLCRSWFVSDGSYSCPGHLRWYLKWMSLFRQVNLAMRSTSVGSTVWLCAILWFLISASTTAIKTVSVVWFPLLCIHYFYWLYVQNWIRVPFFNMQYQSK